MKIGFRAAVSALIIAAVALAGCGGGGGSNNSDNTNDNTILGKVVDTNGLGVPGANVGVSLTGSNQNNGLVTTVTDGGYRIANLFPGVYTVSASALVGAVTYTGSPQVVVASHSIISNGIIEVAPTGQQGVIQGTVVDGNGRGIAGVRVLATVTITPAQGTTANGDLLAVTDHNGNYRFPNVPTATVPYSLTATALGYVNRTATVSTLSNGQTKTVNFTLTGSANNSVPTPTGVVAAALTQPSSVLTPSVVQAHASTPGSVYNTIRKVMSPKYAQWSSNRHTANVSTKLKPHLTGFGPFAIEADVFFDESNITNVSGYRIYNSEDNQPVQPYDFLQDPQASLYVDLDPLYVPNRQFNFAVSAINTDNTESNLSTIASFDPLDLEVVDSPVQGQQTTNPLTINWEAVSGATQYGVFLYNAYPSVDATPVVQATGLTSTSFNVTSTLPPGNYWLLVSAADDNSVNVSISQIIEFQVH